VVVDVERHYAFQSTSAGMLLESRTSPVDVKS
jgi:hypothetical protein